jgi:class 3 adenylate cyclase
MPAWLERVSRIGSSEADLEDLRVRKTVLVLSASLMASLACVWVATYAILGLWLSAAIPLIYQLASVTSIYAFAQNRRYRFFRTSQLGMSLAFPFLLQWSLGGFRTSSAVSLWAFTSPLGALLFVGARDAIGWFVGFVVLVAISAGLDPALASGAPHIPRGISVAFFALNLIGVATTAYVLLQYSVRAREREHARSERLLLNVLPEPVAARLKRGQGVIADACDDVTVLFADLVGFTPLSERLAPTELVALLDRVFARWDQLAAQLGVEKIKTIGDAYMVAAGIPSPREDHAEAIAELALQMGPALERLELSTEAPQVRIGIDTGPVVAGVIGKAKFIYDLWGDTVNTASRMESHAGIGTIQVTERTYERLRSSFELRPRGAIEVKGKGPMNTYELLGRRAPSGEAAAARGVVPAPPPVG